MVPTKKDHARGIPPPAEKMAGTESPWVTPGLSVVWVDDLVSR